MLNEKYFDKNHKKIIKLKYLFKNSDIKNNDNNKDYLSLIRDVGIIKYSERTISGNKTSDSPEKYKLVNIAQLVCACLFV